MFNLFKTNYPLRKDGMYMRRFEGISPNNGEPFKFTIGLLFNNHNRAFLVEEEGFPDIDKFDIKEMIKNISDFMEINPNCTKYTYKNDKLNMKFMEGNNPEYGWEYRGGVVKDYLLLTMEYHFFSYITGKKGSEIKYRDVKFKFVKT